MPAIRAEYGEGLRRKGKAVGVDWLQEGGRAGIAPSVCSPGGPGGGFGGVGTGLAKIASLLQ